ncbi:TIGR02391 family protein [Corynebacterium hadale]
MPDPRGDKMRFFAQKVIINDLPNGSFANMAYTEVHLSKELPPRTAPVRRLSFEGLHPAVAEASADLFADGHFSRAVREAFKSIEVRVRDLLASRTSGTKLMDEAFGGKAPRLHVSLHAGQSGQDEQAGFHAIFRGAMLGIRNPGAHELAVEQDAQEALEHLALASLLHRRLDSSTAES